MGAPREAVEVPAVPVLPRCPSCDQPLLVKWVRGRRYMHCDCDGSQGERTTIGTPTCNLCPESMELRLGERGRWQGRWFWSCPTHVMPNATVKAPPGPADPRSLHHKNPAMGGGFAKRGL